MISDHAHEAPPPDVTGGPYSFETQTRPAVSFPTFACFDFPGYLFK